MKDVVSFYNSFGGYLICGVNDSTRDLIGYDRNFDVEDLNKKVQSSTGHSVECVYRILPYRGGDNEVSIGLLFIPRRPDTKLPARFEKDAPKSENGAMAYKRGTFYMRQRDACEAATLPEHYAFLYSDLQRRVADLGIVKSHMLQNNLPSRDTELGTLVGRSEQLSMLWDWLADDFNSLKLLSGLGGVGKTSIAYSFAEDFVYSLSSHFDKLIWLGAKQQTFAASAGRLIAMSRVDFVDIASFLEELLLETGCPISEIELDRDIPRLRTLVEQHLREFRCLVIIDDVDTLEDENQQEIFHLVTILFARSRSKVLMTARRNLGMPKGQFIEVQGISRARFEEYVDSKCDLLGIRNPVGNNTSLMSQFWDVTGGSPLFTISVLRLVSLAIPLTTALTDWKGASGEDVRNAAFAREVSRLKVPEARALLAAIYLSQTSLVEIALVLEMSRYDTQIAIDSLRQFSMVSLNSDLPGGATLIVPKAISMMIGVVEKKVTDYTIVRKRCAEQRAINNDPVPFVSDAIRRSMAFLKQDEPQKASQVAEEALRRVQGHPDLLCMLGRARYSCQDESSQEADEFFKTAYDNGCRRRELFEYWIESLQHTKDWGNVIQVSTNAERDLNMPGVYINARAHAFFQIAEGFVRGNRLEGAEKIYLKGVEDIKGTLWRRPSGQAQLDLKEWQRKLISSWVGCIYVNEDPLPYSGRVIGALHKSVDDFGFIDVMILQRTLTKLSNYLDSVLSPRKRLTSRAFNIIDRDSKRLWRIEEFVREKMPFSGVLDQVRQCQEVASKGLQAAASVT